MAFILLIGGICLTLGDIILKRWVTNNDWRFAAAGGVLWAAGLCCLAATMKSQNIAVASFMLVFFNIVTLAVAEWYLFSHPISARQIIGLVLGLIAISLLETAA